MVRTAETQKKEQEKRSIEDPVKDYLWSRMISPFFVAYGNEEATLVTFDQIIPGEVFGVG